MDSTLNTVLPFLALLLVCGVIFGSFWGGYRVARLWVAHPVALILLTLLFGTIFTAIVATGLVAGCIAIAGSPNFH